MTDAKPITQCKTLTAIAAGERAPDFGDVALCQHGHMYVFKRAGWRPMSPILDPIKFWKARRAIRRTISRLIMGHATNGTWVKSGPTD